MSKQHVKSVVLSCSQGLLHDTASPYAHKVHFTIYTIKDTSRQLGPWRDRGVQGQQGLFAMRLTTCRASIPVGPLGTGKGRGQRPTVFHDVLMFCQLAGSLL